MNTKALAAAQTVAAQARLREQGSALLACLTAVRQQLAKQYRIEEVWEPLDEATRIACGLVGHDVEQDGVAFRCRTCGEGQ